MQKTNSVSNTKRSSLIFYFAFTLLSILTLAYIDEGRYSFDWMNDSMNWISFSAFFMAVFFSQILFEKIILKNYTGKGKVVISTFGGVFVGLLSLLSATFLVVSIFF